jgi:hypothetical protein
LVTFVGLRCIHSLIDVGLHHLNEFVDVVKDTLWSAQQEILRGRTVAPIEMEK